MATNTVAHRSSQASPAIPRAAQWVSTYTGLVSTIGLAIVLSAFQERVADWPGLIVFAVAAAVVEVSSVELFASGRNSRVSVSSIIAIAATMTFSPLAGALTHAASGVMTLVTTTALQRHSPEVDRVSWLRRSAFNVGMLVVAAAAGGSVYVWLGGAIAQPARASNIVPLVAAVATDVLVNISLLIGVISLQTGQSPLRIWTSNFQWSAPISILGGVIGGGSMSLAYASFGLFGFAVFLVPVVSTGYSFRLYTQHTRRYVDQLEAANRRLDEAIAGLLETLGAMLDADDSYTYGHSAQIALYADTLAEQMGLDAKQRAVITRAALIHDIGKIGIPDRIIGKPGPLTADEFAIMKQHTIIGADLIGRMKGLEELVPIVRHHHERWDGGGYPHRLAGTAIPLAARVVTLADAVEAMCSDRPYRPARSFADVLAEVQRCAGKQFDPAVVEAFFTVVEQKGRGFFKNSAEAVDKRVRGDAVGSLDTATRHLKKSAIVAQTI